ncbi:YtcA family lipoprotein [Paraburkholderia phenazinium]|jgi:hypothetical protein|uniref:Uncharacterized protein YtcA n=1 Tax=Paraburkholderia phenazinium TaxID=60549 RepID=A0A1G8JBT2_9BURK|nr:YtcA family lipoprotein [Paraburkholderia phenazinium]SDI28719.1 Uncharacterised protein family protein [Paraburkholderia phenazinium]
MRTLGFAAVAALLLGGCAQAPSISVLGAYFPGWLFCITAGVILTIVFHVMVERGGLARWFWPRGIVYPALVLLIALIVWLIFFQH